MDGLYMHSSLQFGLIVVSNIKTQRIDKWVKKGVLRRARPKVNFQENDEHAFEHDLRVAWFKQIR